ncbi:MAG TPA: hypothetical protein VGM02_00265, partial [Acidobacteriaceae bacterium]
PDELASLGLDRRLASRKSPDIRAKENIRYELTQPQNDLTPTGLLMEGQCAYPPIAIAFSWLRSVCRLLFLNPSFAYFGVMSV